MTDAVVAKMEVQCVTTQQFSFGRQVKVEMGAIYGKDGGNKAFTDATPSGSCWMQIDAGKPASEFFKPGKRYYLTFTEAPD